MPALLALGLFGSSGVPGCAAGVGGDPSPLGDGDSISGDGDGDGDSGSDFDPDAPEMELEESFRAPVVAGEYLWSANPESNKVARVNAKTLDIDVLEGGHEPTFLAALPEGATAGGALCLNVRSQDASVFVTQTGSEVASHTRVTVQPGASAWAVGSSGKFAIAWSRASDNLLNAGDGYQDLTVLSLAEDSVETTMLSVGFRPSRVMINDAETHAYVVSEPGISVINLLDGVAIERELFLPEVEDLTTRDVSITPDGSLALVRLMGSSEILLVNTATNERKAVVLPTEVTDLDLSEDGTLAVAVMRGGEMIDLGAGGEGGAPNEPVTAESLIALLPVATIFEQPDEFDLVATDEIVGSAVVASDASQVLLFTNANPNDHLTILSTTDQSVRVLDLKAPVRAAFLSEDGAYGVALMQVPSGSNRGGAFALIPVAKALAHHISGTDTPPEFVSISAEAGRVLVTTAAKADKSAATYFGRFPGLQVDRIDLPSRPLASGIVPAANQGFVAQEHVEGRVTFIDLETGSEKTVTGYELSSKVVQ